ncbi:MAG: MATE family efflux transporter [Succinivibrio sp.]
MQKMTVGSEFKNICSFAVPLFAGTIFQLFYNIADSIIVGNFLGKESLAAVGFSFSVIFLLVALSSCISMGASVLAGNYFGAEKLSNIKAVFDTALISSFIVSVIAASLGCYFTDEILSLFSVPDEIRKLASVYLSISFLGAIPSFCYMTICSVLRGLGDAKVPTYILIGSTLVNIILDLVFILYFNFGVAGVALATVISQSLSFVVALIYIRHSYSSLGFSLFIAVPSFGELKKILGIGIPAMMQQLFVCFGNFIIQYLINSFGTDCMAAFTVAVKIDSIFIVPSMVLSQALMNFTSQNYGAGLIARIKRGFNVTLLMSTVLAVIFSCVILMFPEYLILMFTDDTNVIEITKGYFRIVCVFYAVFSAMQVLNGVLMGLRKSFSTMAGSVISLCMIRVPLAVVLSSTSLVYTGIWMATPVGWIGGVMIRMFFYLRAVKNLEKKGAGSMEANSRAKRL